MPHVWEFVLILNINVIFVEGKLSSHYENSLSGRFGCLTDYIFYLLVLQRHFFIMLAMQMYLKLYDYFIKYFILFFC